MSTPVFSPRSERSRVLYRVAAMRVPLLEGAMAEFPCYIVDCGVFGIEKSFLKYH